MSLADAWIESDVVPAAMPPVVGVVEQVAHGIGVFVNRHLDETVLRKKRIEVDDRQHAVSAIK
jgi:hypothetical protein